MIRIKPDYTLVLRGRDGRVMTDHARNTALCYLPDVSDEYDPRKVRSGLTTVVRFVVVSTAQILCCCAMGVTWGITWSVLRHPCWMFPWGTGR